MTGPDAAFEEWLRGVFEADARAAIFRSAYSPNPEAPLLVLLGGQPAAGKTNAQDAVLAANKDAGLVPVTGDDLRQFHPDYLALARDDPLAMPVATAAVSGGLVRLALDHALEHRFSVLLEGTFRDPRMVVATAERFAAAGYRVEVVAVAAPAVVSRLSAEQRSLGRRGGTFGRWTPPQAHEAALAGSAKTVAALEALPAVSQVQVHSRVKLLYENTRDSRGGWQSEPKAAEVLREEQNRRLSPHEAADWLARYEQVVADAVARPGYLGTATEPAFRLLERDAASLVVVAAAGAGVSVGELRRLASARRAVLQAAMPSLTRPRLAGNIRAEPSSPSTSFGQPQRPSAPGREPPGLAF